MTNVAFDFVARDRASRTIRAVSNETERAKRRFDGLRTAAAVGGAAVAAAAVKFGRDSVAAYTESQQAQARLQDAYKRFPALANVQMTSLQALNSELARKTRFDDDATASGQAVLAQFKLTGAQVAQLTPLLQDYAARTGKDLPTAALDLGKAMQGQGRALKAVGIDFRDSGSAAGNYAQLVGGLRAQVGGFAEREGKTAAGQAQILRNQFGELQEQAGAKLVPALTAVAAAGLKVVDFVDRNQRVLVPLVATLGVAAGAVWAVNAAARAYAATQAALNVVMAANPVGLVVLGLAALVAGIVVAYKKSETFRDVVKGALKAVRDAFTGAVSWALGKVSSLLGGFEAMARAAGKLPGPLGAPFRKAADAITKARGKVDTLKGALDELPRNKTVTVAVDLNRTAATMSRLTGGQISVSRAAALIVKGRYSGGPVTDGVRHRDSAVYALRRGEHVWTPEEVDATGGHGAMYRIRRAALAGRLKGFARGGEVAPALDYPDRASPLVRAVNRGAGAYSQGVAADYARRLSADVAARVAGAVRNAAAAAGPTGAVGRGGWAFPLPRGAYRVGGGINSYPGHTGQDFPAARGTPIFAALTGVVSRALSLAGSYGRHVYVNHPGGWQTRYAHMLRYVVRAGQGVRAGQLLGYVDSTGNSTGNHLHFEVRRGGRVLSPRSVLSYDTGGMIPPGGVAVNTGRRPERVLPERLTQSFDALAAAVSSRDVGSHAYARWSARRPGAAGGSPVLGVPTRPGSAPAAASSPVSLDQRTIDALARAFTRGISTYDQVGARQVLAAGRAG